MSTMSREQAIEQAREAITALATATCDCPYETERELAEEIERLRTQLTNAAGDERAWMGKVIDEVERVQYLHGTRCGDFKAALDAIRQALALRARSSHA